MGQKTENATAVCILAGGLSERLRPVSGTLPKPMVPVAGKPFLQFLLEHLSSLGFRRFILAVCFGWEAIRDSFGDGSAFGWQIQYSVEPRPLGTGGAVLWAQKLWGQRALVLNGDTYLPGDWRAMLEFHQAGRLPTSLQAGLPTSLQAGLPTSLQAGLPATMALVWREDTGRFGRVRLADGRVVEFAEKCPGSGAGWINGGAYVLEASALAGNRRGDAFSLERDVFPSLAGRIGAFCCEDVPFVDIGTAESLESFRRIVGGG